MTSLHRDFLPSSWGHFSPTFWDVATLLGSFGLFLTLFCLFVRYLPMVAMSEVKTVLPEAQAASPSDRGSTEWREPEASTEVYGLLAEFASPEQLTRASRGVRQAGYTFWDAHSPFPVHGLERAMRLKRSRVPWFALIFGLAGGAGAMVLQWWVSAVAYPLVISGKPLLSWPAFVPIGFECGVLGGAVGAVGGFLILTRLPQPYHALFGSKRFERATDDKFFISIAARDPRFLGEETTRLLRLLGAHHVELVAG